jgi:predicted  nucleic acid-binding Zn-ribbon protein
MQYDMEVDKFENEMRQSQNRQKLIKQRDFLLNQQNNIKKIEADIAAMSDRLEAVRDEADRLEKLMRAQVDALNTAPPEEYEEIGRQIAALEKLEDAFARYEHELGRMRKDGETRDRHQKDIRLRAARTKAEFDQLKIEYDEEFKLDSVKLNQLKAKAAGEGKSVEEALIKRYAAIKQHVSPPMALLNGERCGGCNMSLPAATLRQVRSDDNVTECDNCGRILFIMSPE